MSIFGLFRPQWSKQFDDLVDNHHEALEAYIQGKYEVFPDMRIDDRLLFQEYRENIDKENYAQTIDALTDSEKKRLANISDNIIRLYRAYLKYDTKQKRVISLMERFCANNVFNTVFGHSSVLGNDWKVEDLDDNQLDYILNNYYQLVNKTTYLQEKKKKKQKQLRDKLLSKVSVREVDRYIREQSKSIIPLRVNVVNDAVQLEINRRLGRFQLDYRENGVYTSVRRILLLGFEDLPIISRDLFVLSREDVFKEGKELFKLTAVYPLRNRYLKQYLSQVKNRYLCLIELFLNKNFAPLDEYIHNENIAKILPEKWINEQRLYNTDIQTLATMLLVGYRSPLISTYISTKGDNNTETRKYFCFIHLMLHEYITKIGESLKSDFNAYSNYFAAQAYQRMERSFGNENQSKINNIINFILTLKGRVSGSMVVLFGSSGSDEPSKFNGYHFNKIIEKLKSKYVRTAEFKDIDKLQRPKYILLLELITSSKGFKQNCKTLLYKFPGTSICYFSIFNEMTKKK